MDIYGKKVKLRAIEPEDCELIREMFNNPDIENLVNGWSIPLSKYSQMKWYEEHINDKNFRFIIETKSQGPLGIVTLMDIDWKNRTASHGIKLANIDNRHKGIGTDSVMALMRYAFDELGLHRMETTILTNNSPSRGLYAKCGWIENGIKRECIYKQGVFRDVILVDILASEYYAFIEKNHYWDLP